jgi:hypothetical protein
MSATTNPSPDLTAGHLTRARRWINAAAVAVFVWAPTNACAAPPQASEDSDARRKGVESESREKQREEAIKVMRERAAQTKVKLVGDDEPQTAELNPAPLLYFTNEPHRIV